MENFVAFNPTKVHFGRNVVDGLGIEISGLGRHALLLYGKGSVMKNGSYHDTMAQLSKQGIKVTEFSGIKDDDIGDM